MTTGVIVQQLETLNGTAPAPSDLPRGDIAQRIAVLNGLMDAEDLTPSNGEICKQLDIYIENGGGSGGGITPEGTLEVTENGTYDVTNYAGAEVNVPGITPEGTLDITENGTYDVTGYAETTVEVPTGGGDEADWTQQINTKIEFSKSYGNRLRDLDIDLRQFDPRNFNNIEALFDMQRFKSVDCRGWVLPGTTLSKVFSECYYATDIRVDGWDTSGIIGMEKAFYYCESLSDLNVASWDFASVTSCSNMFAYCNKLTALIWDIDGTEVKPMPNATIFQPSAITAGTGYVYVPDALVDAYKVATNWASLAKQIKGISELPAELKEKYGITA